MLDLRDEAPAPPPPMPEPSESTAETDASAAAAASGPRPRKRQVGSSKEVDQSLRPAQFYVGAQVDDYLREVRAEAVVRRLDVTASAVVRLAMERLMAEMTPQQVTDHLAQSVASRKGAGRKRR